MKVAPFIMTSDDIYHVAARAFVAPAFIESVTQALTIRTTLLRVSTKSD